MASDCVSTVGSSLLMYVNKLNNARSALNILLPLSTFEAVQGSLAGRSGSLLVSPRSNTLPGTTPTTQQQEDAHRVLMAIPQMTRSALRILPTR